MESPPPDFADMNPGCITLTTDFGEGSPYVAQMKGVILSINPAVTLVDVTHAITPQDIRHGALVLADVAWRFPPGTIHLVVVDPGVGTDRDIVLAKIADHWFVAPDNGLLSLVASCTQPELLVSVANPALRLPHVSATFHGRDIMAPAAAHVSLGVPAGQFGPRLESLTELTWPRARREARRSIGAVLAIDSFGNVITNILEADLPPVERSRLVVRLASHQAVGVVRTYAEASAGSLVALFGSSGRLELAVVNGSAARTLRCTVGDEVIVLG